MRSYSNLAYNYLTTTRFFFGNYSRSSKAAAAASMATSCVESPFVTPRIQPLSFKDKLWTPGPQLQLQCEDDTNTIKPAIEVFNTSMANFADAVKEPRIELLEYQVDSWDECT